MRIASEHIEDFGIKETCRVLDINRSSYYRWVNHNEEKTSSKRRPPRKLSQEEEDMVLEVLNNERFMDQAVPEIHATLLDEGVYICSSRTMYRVLGRHQQVKERRHERRHPVYEKPELLATGKNQVWSWDITKLKGPVPGVFYHLYVVIDIYSRYVVGWLLSDHESGEQARTLLETCYQREGVGKYELTVHSDRGKAMRSKTLAELLADLSVRRSFNRPHVSNDNPYSESQFKTLKYRFDYPERFGSIEDARSYLRSFFAWYNNEHRHSGLAMMTPEAVHTDQCEKILENRSKTLNQAYLRHPERFVKGRPFPQKVPEEVWINKPTLNAA
jgi:putative transposase